MTNSISLFGVVVKDHTNSDLFKKVTTAAIKCGYIVEPEGCTAQALAYFESMKADFNSTFYKTWEEVTSKTREELWLDQVKHYASTYGTDFEGETWTPNDGEHPLFSYNDYKVIKAVTPAELASRCCDMLTSGIALSNEVLEYVCYVIGTFYITESVSMKKYLLESFANKEGIAKLYSIWDIIPDEKFALLRYIATKQLGNAMIIQSDEQIRLIKAYPEKFDFRQLSETQIVNLSSIFLRYKNWLLAFKNKNNKPILNKMRRLAKRTHTPLKRGYWEHILEDCPNFDEVKSKLDEISNFKKVSLYMACLERLEHPVKRAFLIRNQKLWIKDNNLSDNKRYYLQLANLLAESLPKPKVRLPKNFRLAVPSSEKSFIGNLPLGSQYKFPESNGFVGIYWRNEWGTYDFDLHYFLRSGQHIGWNDGYRTRNNSVIFSGDMTNADPEATEIMYLKNNCPEGFVICNRYRGEQGSRFDLILGQEDMTGKNVRNYMVDPNNIHFRAECVSDKMETTCGYVKDNTFTLMSFKTGNKQVTSDSSLIEILANKSRCFLYLDEVCEVVPDDYDGDDFVDLSGEIAKDDIIKLFV